MNMKIEKENDATLPIIEEAKKSLLSTRKANRKMKGTKGFNVPLDVNYAPCPKCGDESYPHEVANRPMGNGLRLYGLRHKCECGAVFISWPLILEEDDALVFVPM